MQEPVKITVVLEGGMVSAVLTAGVPVEYVVVDYDTDGADAADIVDVPQDDGDVAEAYVTEGVLTAEVAGSFVLASHNRFGVPA